MDWSTLQNVWIIVPGALGAMACALLGNFLVLRKLSMMGDAISHAVLPGIAVAFIVTGSRSGGAMFIGAAAVGVLTALLTQWVHRLGKVDEGAAMGVVFTSLFAVGLILIEQAAHHVDLDPGCVLYGTLDTVPLETLAGHTVPPIVVRLGVIFLVNLAFVLVFYKELKISAFDPELATSQGINAGLMHYLLMTLVAATAVVCFESVGSILVIAMLIVPGATAHLLCDRLPTMLILSQVVALLSAVFGRVGAVYVPGWLGFVRDGEGLDTGTAGMIAVVSGLFFAAALFGSPRHGLVAKALRRFRLRRRIQREDVLGLLFRCEEAGSPADAASLEALAAKTLMLASNPFRAALRGLTRAGLVRVDEAKCELTDAGRASARSLVRAHRLWETYGGQELGLPPDHIHDPAERMEHHIDAELAREIEQRLDHPTRDPHGHPIPGDESPDAES